MILSDSFSVQPSLLGVQASCPSSICFFGLRHDLLTVGRPTFWHVHDLITRLYYKCYHAVSRLPLISSTAINIFLSRLQFFIKKAAESWFVREKHADEIFQLEECVRIMRPYDVAHDVEMHSALSVFDFEKTSGTLSTGFWLKKTYLR